MECSGNSVRCRNCSEILPLLTYLWDGAPRAQYGPSNVSLRSSHGVPRPVPMEFRTTRIKAPTVVELSAREPNCRHRRNPER
jgi:hypothetical protein